MNAFAEANSGKVAVLVVIAGIGEYQAGASHSFVRITCMSADKQIYDVMILLLITSCSGW